MESNETKIEMTAKRNREKGVTTVEYAIMLVLVAIAVAGATPGISDAILGTFTEIATLLAP